MNNFGVTEGPAKDVKPLPVPPFGAGKTPVTALVREIFERVFDVPEMDLLVKACTSVVPAIVPVGRDFPPSSSTFPVASANIARLPAVELPGPLTLPVPPIFTVVHFNPFNCVESAVSSCPSVPRWTLPRIAEFVATSKSPFKYEFKPVPPCRAVTGTTSVKIVADVFGNVNNFEVSEGPPKDTKPLPVPPFGACKTPVTALVSEIFESVFDVPEIVLLVKICVSVVPAIAPVGSDFPLSSRTFPDVSANIEILPATELPGPLTLPKDSKIHSRPFQTI